MRINADKIKIQKQRIDKISRADITKHPRREFFGRPFVQWFRFFHPRVSAFICG
jgi:hypothetical protein